MLNQTQQDSENSSTPAIVQYEYAPPTVQEQAPVQEARPLTRDEMVALQRRLVSKDKLVSGPAEQELAAMNTTAIIAFIAFERSNRSRRIKASVVGIMAWFSILLTLSIVSHATGMLGTLGSMTSLVAGAAAFTSAHKSGVIALTRLGNTESVGELISAIEIQDPEVQKVVRPTLIRMLPELRASDTRLLSEDNRQTLRKFLKGKSSGKIGRTGDYETDAQLRIATLNALRQIGDGSFIEIVTDIANGDGPQVYRLAPDIESAARECLPYLQQRALDAAASSQLLRASNANSLAGADILLRPVTATQEMHEGELLRPSEE